ncbi:PAS domain S-box-containing protein/diguanylate cyclase (GGDEF)-like protein [Kineococcus xinjiangensis]|uniref:PAS domain S-box-containing protein/diguanylate cyclase (GGDEF)-like protein n=1 Tax=Kineococcus xinjiangensis TaxID=512762 RepID=A0A2S6IVG5_9ACTN|nr:GGDEF and EAL domain-containing protein [Kineococcus xinjiangensis]PPK98198.1 PAS domain S-box-containing protein/diguanylate cyclase (GGDEF)-like protein [Kineococcus xinjiangensis]
MSPSPDPAEPDATRPDAAPLLDDLDEVVFRTDAAGNWTFLSSAWTRLTGFTVEETLGTNFLDYVHQDEVERTLALFGAVVSGGAVHCHHEGRYRTSAGGYRHVRLRAKVLRDEQGGVVGNVGTLVDVTAERLGAQAAAEHAHLLELVAAGGAAFDDLPIGVVELAPDLRVRRCTPALRQLIGPAVEGGAPLSRLGDVLRPTGGGPVLLGPHGMVATAAATGRAQHADLAFRNRAGGEHEFRVTVLALQSAQERVLTLVLQDVSERRRAERQQSAVSELGGLALAGMDLPDLFARTAAAVRGVLGVTHCEVLERADDEGTLLTRATSGWAAPDFPHVLDRAELEGTIVPAGDAASLLCDLTATVHHSEERRRALAWWRRRGIAGTAAVVVGGTASCFGFLCVQTTTPRAFTADEVAFMSSVAHVVAAAVERRRTEEWIRHRALHDPLTGLANRVLLHDRLHHALAAQQRDGNRLALLLVDLDRFKEVNDTLGHDVGDRVLQVVAERLRQQFRETDTVARLGGDEFAVLLDPVSGRRYAERLAAELRKQIRRPIAVEGLTLHLEGSVGVTLAPDHGEEPVGLLKRADVAMYRAKQHGTGVETYEADADLNRPERLGYGGALREALDCGQLQVHYQPKRDLRTGELAGVEALARWQHPTQGLIPPDSFIPLAEQTGLIRPLTAHVLAAALEQAARWAAAGLRLHVAVNVSARSLHDGSLVDEVVQQLEQTRTPASALELELTESAVMSNPEQAMAVAARLRELGVRMALDDFGTGYSSLAYLRDLPVDVLKIDRSFLQDLSTNCRNVSIVRSVIDLGHNLGMRVVAEGVETPEALDLLQDLGCDQGQGYLFGRPVPAADLVHP